VGMWETVVHGSARTGSRSHRKHSANNSHEVGDEVVEGAVLKRLHDGNGGQVVLENHGRDLGRSEYQNCSR